MSTITDRIEELLEQNGLSKKEMLARVGVTASAFSQWKLEQSQPRLDKLYSIADYLQTPVSRLFEKEKSAPPEGDADKPIIQIYNDLNERGRTELERYGNYLRSQDVYKRTEAEPHVEHIRHYLVPAAAGYASPIEGEDYETIPLDQKAPRGADFCVTIRGDSMEPYIHDGDLVYVKRGADNMQPFDVGIFYVDGDVLCKQFCVDSYRNLYLLSANPMREDANRTIKADGMSSVVCFGKVLLPHKLPQPTYF